jgi:hypothetical protein
VGVFGKGELGVGQRQILNADVRGHGLAAGAQRERVKVFDGRR